MKRLMLALALSAIALPALAQDRAELHTFHCLHGCPEPRPPTT